MNILIGGPLPQALQKALGEIGTVHVLPGEQAGGERDAFLEQRGAEIQCLIWPPFVGAAPARARRAPAGAAAYRGHGCGL